MNGNVVADEVDQVSVEAKRELAMVYVRNLRNGLVLISALAILFQTTSGELLAEPNADYIYRMLTGVEIATLAKQNAFMQACFDEKSPASESIWKLANSSLSKVHLEEVKKRYDFYSKESSKDSLIIECLSRTSGSKQDIQDLYAHRRSSILKHQSWLLSQLKN